MVKITVFIIVLFSHPLLGLPSSLLLQFFPPKTCMDFPLHKHITRVANSKLSVYLQSSFILQ